MAGLVRYGVMSRDALIALPKVYKAYREGLNYAEETARWHADRYRLRDAHPRQAWGSGVSMSSDRPKVSSKKWRSSRRR